MKIVLKAVHERIMLVDVLLELVSVLLHNHLSQTIELDIEPALSTILLHFSAEKVQNVLLEDVVYMSLLGEIAFEDELLPHLQNPPISDLVVEKPGDLQRVAS